MQLARDEWVEKVACACMRVCIMRITWWCGARNAVWGRSLSYSRLAAGSLLVLLLGSLLVLLLGRLLVVLLLGLVALGAHTVHVSTRVTETG